MIWLLKFDHWLTFLAVLWLVGSVVRMGQLGRVKENSPEHRNERTPKKAISSAVQLMWEFGGIKTSKIKQNLCVHL